MLQRTIKKPISVVGIGLHSGARVNLSLKPHKINGGICFIRVDLENKQQIKLNPYLINDTRLSSTIVTPDGIRIGTIEHLISALCCLGIDNILIELDAPEIPIMDGSSLPFIYLIKEAVIVEQKEEKIFYKILKKVEILEKDKSVSLEPYNGFKIDFKIDFDHPVFKKNKQNYHINFSKQSYIDEIARARTFGFMKEVELMRTYNLGLGGNLNNAIVVDDFDVLNKDGLRYPDEFVRHKVLDAIGDLYVVGHQIIGALKGVKSGHAVNNKLMRKLLEDKTNFKKVVFPNDLDIPNAFHYIPNIVY